MVVLEGDIGGHSTLLFDASLYQPLDAILGIEQGSDGLLLSSEDELSLEDPELLSLPLPDDDEVTLLVDIVRRNNAQNKRLVVDMMCS